MEGFEPVWRRGSRLQVLKMTALLRVQWYPMILRVYHFIVSKLVPIISVQLQLVRVRWGFCLRNGYIYKSILLSDVCLLGKTKRLLSWGHIFFSVNSHLQTCLLFGCLGQLVVFWSFDGRSLEGFDCDVEFWGKFFAGKIRDWYCRDKKKTCKSVKNENPVSFATMFMFLMFFWKRRGDIHVAFRRILDMGDTGLKLGSVSGWAQVMSSKSTIAFVFPGLVDHVDPTLPVCRGLVQMGWQVEYICDTNFRDAIEETGAIFHDATGQASLVGLMYVDFTLLFLHTVGSSGIRQIV